MSNSFDPDPDQHFVRSDLGPNCLQRLSADEPNRQRVNHNALRMPSLYCSKVDKGHNFNTLIQFITKPSIYRVIVYFLLCHESLNY